jgi:hypothetical protein
MTKVNLSVTSEKIAQQRTYEVGCYFQGYDDEKIYLLYRCGHYVSLVNILGGVHTAKCGSPEDFSAITEGELFEILGQKMILVTSLEIKAIIEE